MCTVNSTVVKSVFIFVFFKNQAFIVVIVALLASVRQRSLGICFLCFVESRCVNRFFYLYLFKEGLSSFSELSQ